MKLDKKKLLEWLEEEMKDDSQGYRAAMKWVAYQIERGKFDVAYRDIFYADEMKEIRYKYYGKAYEQGRFDEYAESTYGGSKDIKFHFNQNKQEPYTIKSEIKYEGKLPKKERIE